MSDNRTSSIIEEKTLVRRYIRAKRNALSHQERAAKSHALCTKLAGLLGIGAAAESAENSAARVIAHDRALDMPALREGGTVALYAAFEDEANLDELIGLCHRNGMNVALPCMNPKGSSRPMEMRTIAHDAWQAGEVPFVSNPLLRMKPDDEALAAFPAVDPSAIDAMIVPLVAFDEKRRRLGYGGGNYDAYLSLVSPACRVIGVAFEEQRADRVPTEEHDLPLPCIVFA